MLAPCIHHYNQDTSHPRCYNNSPGSPVDKVRNSSLRNMLAWDSLVKIFDNVTNIVLLNFKTQKRDVLKKDIFDNQGSMSNLKPQCFQIKKTSTYLLTG